MSNEQRSKKVIITLPVLLLGGTEIQTLFLVEALVSAGHRVAVCCCYDYDDRVADLFRKAGTNLELLSLRREDGMFHLLRKLVDYFRSAQPDIIHVQYLAPGLVPVIAARLAGVRTVFATVHIAGSIVYGAKAKVLLRTAAFFCTAFFCVSRGVEKFWFGESEVFNPGQPSRTRKHFTIYNAVDQKRIEHTVRETDRDAWKVKLGISDKRVIGAVSRIAHQKGLTFLLAAMPSVIERFPNTMLLIIGKGPDEEKLKKKATDLGLKDRIVWLGEQNQDVVFELYSILDIFVMPSLYEGFGLTAAEAMAAGLPVVGTQVDGLNEIVMDGITGRLVPAGDSTALAHALIELLNNMAAAEAMGRRGIDRVKQLFSVDAFSRSWLAAYRVFNGQ